MTKAKRPMCDLAPGSKVMQRTFRRQSTSAGFDPNRTRMECWGATSADGRWRFDRIEEPGTPWLIVAIDPAVPPGMGWVTQASSLAKAREYVARGWADTELQRRLRKMRGEPEQRPTSTAPTGRIWVD